MKVFWSWQSDHPGKISRHFIRGAIAEAIGKLNAENDIIDADREIELDHDRKGVPGSPDLARVILEKIDASNVFVADVTPVGTTQAEKPKKLINPNVAIELGYALAKIGDRGLIMVMNEHYGNRDELPFDLRHKAGPILYTLAPDASKAQIADARKQLSEILKTALSEIRRAIPAPIAEAFPETPSVPGDPSRFAAAGGILVPETSRYGIDVKALQSTAGAQLYLRVIPTGKLPNLRKAEASRFVEKLLPLDGGATGKSANEWGAISYGADDRNGILSGTQLFQNREIWGFDSILLRNENGGGKTGVPTQAIEKALRRYLRHYLDFATNELKLSPPFTVEAGAFPIKGYVLIMPRNYTRDEWGPIHHDHVQWRGTLNSTSDADVQKALLNIYEAFFDACGVERPQHLNNFPPQPKDKSQ